MINVRFRKHILTAQRTFVDNGRRQGENQGKWPGDISLNKTQGKVVAYLVHVVLAAIGDWPSVRVLTPRDCSALFKL